MFKLFYCPACHKLDVDFKFDPKKHKVSWLNCRGGYGIPIRHIFCSCGSDMAGYSPVWFMDVVYFIDTIKLYFENQLSKK